MRKSKREPYGEPVPGRQHYFDLFPSTYGCSKKDASDVSNEFDALVWAELKAIGAQAVHNAKKKDGVWYFPGQGWTPYHFYTGTPTRVSWVWWPTEFQSATLIAIFGTRGGFVRWECEFSLPNHQCVHTIEAGREGLRSVLQWAMDECLVRESEAALLKPEKP